MSIIIPIVITALLLGVYAKKMTPALWTLMSTVILVVIVFFYARH